MQLFTSWGREVLRGRLGVRPWGRGTLTSEVVLIPGKQDSLCVFGEQRVKGSPRGYHFPGPKFSFGA